MTGPDDPAWRWEFHCEDFVYARLAEQNATAETLPPGPERESALHHVDTLYLLASEHNIWVDARGQSAARCLSCPATSGVPCTTMRALARLWPEHPDYVADWNRSIDDSRETGNYTRERYKQRITIYQERAAELLPFYDRFDLQRDSGGEYWQCRTCPARGESHRPLLPGGYDHPFAINDATRQHPACPTIENKEPTT